MEFSRVVDCLARVTIEDSRPAKKRILVETAVWFYPARLVYCPIIWYYETLNLKATGLEKQSKSLLRQGEVL